MPKAAADTNNTDRGEAGAQLRRRFAPALFHLTFPGTPWLFARSDCARQPPPTLCAAFALWPVF